jgi:hypothetical protein
MKACKGSQGWREGAVWACRDGTMGEELGNAWKDRLRSLIFEGKH